jgi:hypothetical protein
MSTSTLNQTLKTELQQVSSPVYIIPATMSFSDSNITNPYGGRF